MRANRQPKVGPQLRSTAAARSGVQLCTQWRSAAGALPAVDGPQLRAAGLAHVVGLTPALTLRW